jgi:signal transduction histidine kinase
LGTLFEKAVKMIACKAQEKGLHFKFSIDPGVYCKIRIDKARFTQVLMNLISNAIKFTLQGEIEAVVNMQTKNDDRLKAIVSIRDTGIGIAKDKIPIIFEEFIQVDGASNRKYSGIGLGLTIAKEITDLMKGRIWVDSDIGKGSTFYFSCSFDLVKD